MINSGISIFSSLNTINPIGNITIKEFLNAVKSGEWKNESEMVRNEPNEEIQKKLKVKTPAVTISGIFSKKKESCLIKHSGCISIDVDDFVDRSKLINDKYTFALFSSVSNTGIAIIVRIDASKHKESFRWLQNYYFKEYGIVIDPAPSNPVSTRLVSYDPNLYINEKSEISKTLSDKPIKIKSLPIIIPQDKVNEMIKDVVSRGINIAEDYHSYITLGFALASGFGEDGRAYFHALAGVSDKYNQQHTDKQYTISIKRPNKGISVGTFFWMLKNAGIEIPRNPKYEAAIRATVMQKKANLSPESTIKFLKEIHGYNDEDATTITKEVFTRNDISLTTIAADPEKLIQSLVSWLDINHPLKKNTLTGKIEDNKAHELSKEDFNTIYLHARACFNTPNVSFELFERIIFSNFTSTYHPLLKYIDDHSHLSPSGNIDRLIASIKTPTPNADIFIRKWLLSIPAAIKGEPIRLVLSLVGKQKTGKTSFFRRLLPDSLKKYYGESKFISGKDDELLMTQKLILMDDELSGKSKIDERRFKELTSKDIFSIRAPYDRINRDYKRLAVLCGTSNELQIINDSTGNTRILPIEVESIDFHAYNSIDKDELFMEAVNASNEGQQWDLTSNEVDKLAETSHDYEDIPFERELILKHFTTADNAEGNGFVQELSATEIKNHIELYSKQQIKSMRKFGIELRKILGERKSKLLSGKVIKVYSAVCLDNHQEQSYRKVKDPSIPSQNDSMSSQNDEPVFETFKSPF